MPLVSHWPAYLTMACPVHSRIRIADRPIIALCGRLPGGVSHMEHWWTNTASPYMITNITPQITNITDSLAQCTQIISLMSNAAPVILRFVETKNCCIIPVLLPCELKIAYILLADRFIVHRWCSPDISSSIVYLVSSLAKRVKTTFVTTGLTSAHAWL